MFSTYLGGSHVEDELDIAIDQEGNAFVTGNTQSSDFPLDKPIQSELKGQVDAFITEISADGLKRPFSTYLGGNEEDYGLGIEADTDRDFFMSGEEAVDYGIVDSVITTRPVVNTE